jgi:dolichol kinase
VQAFVDERDTGVIYITHFTLLLGLAVPMWLCLVMPGAQALVQPHPLLLDAPAQHGCSPGSAECSGSVSGLTAVAYALLGRSRVGWSDTASALLQVTAGLSGLVIIGVGDTAASFVGKLFGRVPVHAGSSKTVEGTLAGISASLVAWVLVLGAVQLLPGLSAHGFSWWAQLVGATAGAGLMEAATSQLDNILLPLWYLPHLLLV